MDNVSELIKSAVNARLKNVDLDVEIITNDFDPAATLTAIKVTAHARLLGPACQFTSIRQSPWHPDGKHVSAEVLLADIDNLARSLAVGLGMQSFYIPYPSEGELDATNRNG